jgi:hypothetical protein
MNYVDNIITMESQQPVIQKAPGKRFIHSLEYDMIANLAIKQYSNGGEEASFDRLLSIPLKERIPGLINEYGLKRAHRLIKTILQEFIWSVPLPKSAKLTETKISAVGCDLILAAYEDQLAIEDFIVFFERAKKGKYGKFKGTITHFSIMEKLNQYRSERTTAYQSLKAEQDAQVKRMSNIPRIGDTKSIGEILQGADVIDMTKRMSG